MATATLHLDNVEGYSGYARCYHLDPPRSFGADGVHEYVTIWIGPRRRHLEPYAAAIPARPDGTVAIGSMKTSVGSFTLADDPNTPAYIEGAFTLALGLLGGYTVESTP